MLLTTLVTVLFAASATPASAGINDGLPHIQSYAKAYKGVGVLRVSKWGVEPWKEVLKKDNVDCPFAFRELVTNPYDTKSNYVVEVESPLHSEKFRMMFGGWGWVDRMHLPDLRGKAHRYINFSSGRDGWGATQIRLFFDTTDRVMGVQLSSMNLSLPAGWIPVPGGSLPHGPQEQTDTQLACNLY